MGIWLELALVGLVFVFAFWQMRDVRKAQEQTRLQRVREKAAQALKGQGDTAEVAAEVAAGGAALSTADEPFTKR